MARVLSARLEMFKQPGAMSIEEAGKVIDACMVLARYCSHLTIEVGRNGELVQMTADRLTSMGPDLKLAFRRPNGLRLEMVAPDETIVEGGPELNGKVVTATQLKALNIRFDRYQKELGMWVCKALAVAGLVFAAEVVTLSEAQWQYDLKLGLNSRRRLMTFLWARGLGLDMKLVGWQKPTA